MKLMNVQLMLPCIFAALSLVMTFPQQEQRAEASVRLIEKFGDTTCEMIDVYLDSYREAILKEPSAEAHVLAYAGRSDPPGRFLRYLRHIKGHLGDSLGKESRQVSVIDGGQRDKLSIEHPA